MNFLLIYSEWPRLPYQTEFNLPPHGPVVMAAAIPDWVQVTFVDENMEEIPFHGDWDLIGISTMLTCQLPRAFEISELFMKNGKQVIFGGIAAMLHAEEVGKHATSVFLGEAEGRMEDLLHASRGYHPIEDDDEVLDSAARAGAWYVYQAVFDMSDFIKNRIERALIITFEK